MATTLNPAEAGAPSVGHGSRHGLDIHGIRNPGTVFWNLNPVELVEHAIRRGEGNLVDGGPFNAVTTPHTGRSPNDRFIVREPGSEGDVDWGKVNVAFEAENYDQFIRPDPEDADVRDQLVRRHGTPEENPGFWRQNSSRPYLDRITEPVLMVHGRFDDTCPPRWATATQRALERAGVSSELEWYDDGHAFGRAFFAAMDRTVAFLDSRLR